MKYCVPHSYLEYGYVLLLICVRILKHAGNNLSGSEISSNCDYESKHCQARIKKFCLRCKSEFHFVSPLVVVLNCK